MVTESFGVVDFVVFVVTLCMSAGIGVYFGCFGSKQKSATEYLYGKGSMKAIPIGLSIYSSAISAVTIAATPSEIYTFGTQFFMNYIGVLLSLILTWYFVLPVFCGNLKIKTPYEYFELRFNYKIQLLSTTIYVLNTILYMPVVLYAATVTFSEAAQISLPVCTTIIGGVCIFYTMLGGFSAVIWSDTLQATLMLGSCIFVMIKGIIDVGGMTEILHRAEQGERLKFFTWDPNPFQRLTIWSAIIGMCFNHGAHSGYGASSIQRYMALKTEKQARISTAIGVIGSAISGVVVCMIGLNMFAQYYDCDPVKNQDVGSHNKLLSHYVAYTVRNFPGYLGFFNAGILSAGLSTLSAELNTVSGIIYHCFIQKYYKKSISESRGAIIMKIIVLINGLYYLSVAPILDKFKHLSNFAFGITGLTCGAKIGMMVLGTTFPKCNSIGVGFGTIVGMITIGWINFGAQYYDINAPYVLPLSTENCNKHNFTEIFNLTFTTTNSNLLETTYKEPFFIYKLSYMYYSFLGTLITIILALIASYLTGTNDGKDMDPNLFVPWVRPKQKESNCEETKFMLSCVENKLIN